MLPTEARAGCSCRFTTTCSQYVWLFTRKQCSDTVELFVVQNVKFLHTAKTDTAGGWTGKVCGQDEKRMEADGGTEPDIMLIEVRKDWGEERREGRVKLGEQHPFYVEVRAVGVPPFCCLCTTLKYLPAYSTAAEVEYTLLMLNARWSGKLDLCWFYIHVCKVVLCQLYK